MRETTTVTILCPPQLKSYELLTHAEDAASAIGARVIGTPDRVDHGIVAHNGHDVDLRANGLHAVTFTLERDTAK